MIIPSLVGKKDRIPNTCISLLFCIYTYIYKCMCVCMFVYVCLYDLVSRLVFNKGSKAERN